MPREFDFGWVFGYYIVIGVVAAGISLFWTMVFGPSAFERLLMEQGQTSNPIVDFLLSPLVVTVALFIITGIVHLFLMMFGGNKYGFGTSLRVFCFSIGPTLFEIVPFLGGAAGGIWSIVITVIGLREAHETSTGRAVAAVLVPVFFLILLIGLLVMLGLLLGASQLRV